MQSAITHKDIVELRTIGEEAIKLANRLEEKFSRVHAGTLPRSRKAIQSTVEEKVMQGITKRQLLKRRANN